MTDSSLLELFRAELEVHLPALNEGLLALERDARDPKRLEALMRAAHSIKGAAKIVGVEAAVRVAHVLEDRFVAAQQGQLTLTSDAVDVLLRGVDALHRVGAGEAVPDAELGRLVEAIAAVRGGSVPSPVVVVRAYAEPGPPTLRPGGNLDAAEAESLRHQLAELLARGVPRVRLDFAAVGDIDPPGLGLLVRAARAAALTNPPVSFTVVNASPQVRTLLRVTRLDEAFPLADGGAA
jgi:two-component system sensor histidine kinase and response regulator WspE